MDRAWKDQPVERFTVLDDKRLCQVLANNLRRHVVNVFLAILSNGLCNGMHESAEEHGLLTFILQVDREHRWLAWQLSEVYNSQRTIDDKRGRNRSLSDLR